MSWLPWNWSDHELLMVGLVIIILVLWDIVFELKESRKALARIAYSAEITEHGVNQMVSTLTSADDQLGHILRRLTSIDDREDAKQPPLWVEE